METQAAKTYVTVRNQACGLGRGPVIRRAVGDEKDKVASNLLKFTVLAVSDLAILHKLRPFGFALF